MFNDDVAHLLIELIHYYSKHYMEVIFAAIVVDDKLERHVYLRINDVITRNGAAAVGRCCILVSSLFVNSCSDTGSVSHTTNVSALTSSFTDCLHLILKVLTKIAVPTSELMLLLLV